MSKQKTRKKPITNFYDKWLYWRSAFYPHDSLQRKRESNEVWRRIERYLKKRSNYHIPA